LREDRARGGAESWRDGTDLLTFEAGIRRPANGPGQAAEESGEGERQTKAAPGDLPPLTETTFGAKFPLLS
jgi:hypothetical protein